MANDNYSIIGQNDFDGLIAGNQFPVMVKGVTLAAAQGVLTRGTLLGINSTTSLATQCKKVSTDGSQTPKYILAGDTDTGAAGSTTAIPSVAYQSGVFNRSAIILASGETMDSFEDTLRMNNIILTDSMANPTV
jgi:hypothetical protein